MIDIIFGMGTDLVLVRIDGNNVFFKNQSTYNSFMPIEGIHLSKAGVEKEFPDLKGNESWRTIAIQRFKDHIKGLNNEDKVSEYIQKDLQKHGYLPMYYKKGGHRTVKLIN
jgi:hypothetical protein